MPANAEICRAIHDEKVITFTYSDQEGNPHNRVVEPYAHGLTKQDNLALRGYQIRGTSESKFALPCWRMFLIEKMTQVTVTDESFADNAPGYAHGDPDLNPIYCRVP